MTIFMIIIMIIIMTIIKFNVLINILAVVKFRSVVIGKAINAILNFNI